MSQVASRMVAAARGLDRAMRLSALESWTRRWWLITVAPCLVASTLTVVGVVTSPIVGLAVFPIQMACVAFCVRWACVSHPDARARTQRELA